MNNNIYVNDNNVIYNYEVSKDNLITITRDCQKYGIYLK